jgi:transposase-like protein
VDETYIRGKGKWLYLYRAVDAAGQGMENSGVSPDSGR